MKNSFHLFLQDQLSPLGPIHIRKMFGGAGIYLDGVMFALTAGNQLFLKANAATKPDFEAAGMSPFTYEKNDGKTVSMSYYGVNEELLDNQELLLEWARKALLAATTRKKTTQ